MAKTFRFLTVDVFTGRPFSGNPLAVFPDARGMTARQMQQLAREFNYAESTFVLPPRNRAHTARVRIFTPMDEIPFAGHPNVGTAFVLASTRLKRASTLLFEEGAGLVPVDVLRDRRGRVTGAMLTAPQPLQIGDRIPADTVARCLGLEPGSIVTTHHEPVVASVGLPFVVAEAAADSLARIRTDTQAFEQAAERHPTRSLRFSIFVYARETDTRLRARMFAPLSGVPEDPATGSANCALAGLLARLAPARDAVLELDVRQGVEMGRPSRLLAIAEKKDGAVTRIRVGGRCALAMLGRVSL
ncbi:MAG TPA: PhzF family phenazine biosynthesis protein [Burkholderiales bacterium]|nr:PhzF family phenazine biosynthesis protein [Burkholderiales bacterium]